MRDLQHRGRLYTRDVRGQGIGAALLNRVVQWANEQGYVRCAVDFEPTNVLAARFWMRHFRPVSYALVRYIQLGIGE